jgi:hypothetical protein
MSNKKGKSGYGSGQKIMDEKPKKSSQAKKKK